MSPLISAGPPRQNTEVISFTGMGTANNLFYPEVSTLWKVCKSL